MVTARVPTICSSYMNTYSFKTCFTCTKVITTSVTNGMTFVDGFGTFRRYDFFFIMTGCVMVYPVVIAGCWDGFGIAVATGTAVRTCPCCGTSWLFGYRRCVVMGMRRRGRFRFGFRCWIWSGSWCLWFTDCCSGCGTGGRFGRRFRFCFSIRRFVFFGSSCFCVCVFRFCLWSFGWSWRCCFCRLDGN